MPDVPTEIRSKPLLDKLKHLENVNKFAYQLNRYVRISVAITLRESKDPTVDVQQQIATLKEKRYKIGRAIHWRARLVRKATAWLGEDASFLQNLLDSTNSPPNFFNHWLSDYPAIGRIRRLVKNSEPESRGDKVRPAVRQTPSEAFKYLILVQSERRGVIPIRFQGFRNIQRSISAVESVRLLVRELRNQVNIGSIELGTVKLCGAIASKFDSLRQRGIHGWQNDLPFFDPNDWTIDRSGNQFDLSNTPITLYTDNSCEGWTKQKQRIAVSWRAYHSLKVLGEQGLRVVPRTAVGLHDTELSVLETMCEIAAQRLADVYEEWNELVWKLECSGLWMPSQFAFIRVVSSMLSQSKGESDLRLAGKNSAKFDHPLLPNFDESPHEIEEARTEDTQCPDDIQSCEQKFRAILEATDDKDWKPGGEAVRKKMSKVWTGRQKGWIFGTNDNRVGFVNTQRTPIVSRWNVDHWDQLIETSRIEALTNFFSAYPTGNFRMSPSRNEE